MAHSGRTRHRDRDPGLRRFDEPAAAPAANRRFQITEAERQQIAELLRHIDDARVALERQHNPDNRQIIRDLRAAADQIFEVINGLEETHE
jgi:hypothetical protein